MLGVIDSDAITTSEATLVLDKDPTTHSKEGSFLTSLENVSKLTDLPQDQQEEFRSAQADEVRFLLKDAITPIAQHKVEPHCELQPLKWVLGIKRSTNASHVPRYRAMLVSAWHLSLLRHSLDGNAPTVAISTIRLLLSVAPTWSSLLRSQGDSLLLLVCEVTKAYLQSKPSGRLVYYQPPPEFFNLYPDKRDHVWKGNVQLYGDVEAGKYWHKTFVPWLCTNIIDYKQALCDPSLLYSPSLPAATALCTDDALTIIPASHQHQEAKISKRFQCRDAQLPPTEFKGLDILREGDRICISQAEYSKKINVSSSLDSATKPELSRDMTQEEISQLRSDAGKLAWLAVGTSPLSSFQASVALQRDKGKRTPILRTLLDTRRALLDSQNSNNTEIQYVSLHEDSIHIRVYSDGSFQNLPTKHSQIGFIIGIADKDDKFNIIHWHSSRAPRRPCSTEQSELMALDIALRTLENIRSIIFALLKGKFRLLLMLTVKRCGLT